MRPKYSLTFHEVQQPITEPVTKFGGQPTWLTAHQWPLSRSTGESMRFICQIALDPQVFGEIPGRMAYLFIADDEDSFVDDTFDPDSGENAVIIQPGTNEIPTQPLLTGPTLYKMVSRPSEKYLVPESCEFTVEISPGEDPEVIVEDEHAHESPQAWAQFTELWSEIKIGGTPAFLQGPEFPEDGNWRLLLQLDSANVPFYVNFGDAGVGYAFLSQDGTSGKYLWQCI
jgi:uncharacterized protein YwqG